MRKGYSRTPSEEDRFWERVDKDGPIPEYCPSLGPCWVWRLDTNQAGYAMFQFDHRQMRAHRWSYQHVVGPIPDGLVLDHLCRVRHCVRPSHLEAVTGAVNNSRSLIGNRNWSQQRTECDRGHPFTPENSYWFFNAKIGRATRVCRQCRYVSNKRYQKSAKGRATAKARSERAATRNRASRKLPAGGATA